MRAALPVLLLSVMLAEGCARPQEAPVRSEPVRVGTATRGELSQGITFRANLRATRRASVNAAAPGMVARVAVHEGDRVRAGQPIAWLDATEVEARIREQEAVVQAARARVASSRANVELSSHGVTGDVRQAASSPDNGAKTV